MLVRIPPNGKHGLHRASYRGVTMMKAALALATMLCLAVGSARAQDRPEVFPQLGHFGEVLGLAISPDGAMVASSGSDNAVRIWEAATVREIRTLGQHIDAWSLRFRPTAMSLSWLRSTEK